MDGHSSSRDPAESLVDSTSADPIHVNAARLPAAQIKTIFQEQIAAMYGVRENGIIVQSRRYRYFGSGDWRVESSRGTALPYRILQHIEGSRYLASGTHYNADTFAIDIEGRQYPDNTVLNLLLEHTGQLYSYTSVLGAKRTVRVMQVAYEPDLLPIKYEEFVASIKDGHTFDALIEHPIPCPTCKSTGFVNKDDNKKRIAVREFCPTCKGKKTIIREILCRLHPPAKP